MARPRPELGDRSKHEIRNTRQGIDLLFPNALMRWAFMFLLATAARRYNIGIVAYAMMPNHIHIVVNPGVDPNRDHDLPEFRKFLNSNLARVANKLRGISRGHVFCRDSVGDSIKIVDAASELQQLSYVELNAVAAGMGRRPEDLDGMVSQRRWLTAPRVVKRPPFYFQERTWKEEETLQLCVPKIHRQLGYDRVSFRKLSSDRVNRDVKRIRKRLRKNGVVARSVADLEADGPTLEPRTSVADHSRAWIVGEDKVAKAEEFHRLEAWWSWHEDAMERVRNGEDNVVFPPGTYKAAKQYGCRVASVEYYQAKVRRRDEGTLERKYGRKLLNDSVRVAKLE